MINQFNKILYGGDYNPDQWDDATILEDMLLFKKAHINLVTLPVFSWAKLEPDEGVYDFAWLDKILDIIHAHGISVNLATPTVAQPAWLSHRYPEVLPVDKAGRKRTHGMRVFFCVNSLKYRERAAAIAEYMANRYKDHPALVMWHVANEYGTSCYCETCEAQFRVWLRKKYGSIQKLNECWHTCFWGRTVYSFEEIYLPTERNDDYRFNPNIELEYQRFLTDSTIDCYLNEYNILKRITPHIPVSTNMSGYIKKLDQFEFTKHMDYVGWDNYPWPVRDKPHFVGFKHDLMRGLKDGQSFLLAEQSPNQQNWQPYNKLKRPGEVRLLSYQAIARGADSSLFFQLRQSIAGQEKWHGAIIGHAGHEDTRIFKECAKLGEELEILSDRFLRARTPAQVGMFFDWDTWRSVELSSGPSKDMDYLKFVTNHYKPFHDHNIAVDVLNVHRDLSEYKIIVAPMLYMMKPGVAERITEYVKHGGIFIATTMTGLVDEHDRSRFGEYPGALKDVLGIWVEETDALFTHEYNRIIPADAYEGLNKQYSCNFLCDLLHLRGAQALAHYGADFYQGMPCVTVNAYGKGKAYYLGTQADDAFLNDFMMTICAQADIKPLLNADAGVEITERVGAQGRTIFIINNNDADAKVYLGNEAFINGLTKATVSGTITIKAKDVIILFEA